MKLRIRLLAIDPCPHLPKLSDDGFEWYVDSQLSLESVLKGLQLPLEKAYLTLCNGRSVPDSERPNVSLHDNDVITIFPLIKGG
ncbi:MAG TPA: hypothetical protein ENI62_13680 [Gammaproteobacteria bacterium]|nr:hypothetical protein [Gammaproteobacteria bacterium]